MVFTWVMISGTEVLVVHEFFEAAGEEPVVFGNVFLVCLKGMEMVVF